MRAVGEFKEEEKARAFSAFLECEGIENEAEEEDGVWTVWVQYEECLDRATRELERFRKNPHRAEYLKASRQAEEKPKPKKSTGLGRFKQINLRRKWSGVNRFGIVTIALILITSAVFLGTEMGELDKITNKGNPLFQSLVISERSTGGLPEIVEEGEVWRLVTSTFVHLGPVHFVFNMMCLFYLGGMIEDRKGKLFLLCFVLLVAVGSNLVSYYLGPHYTSEAISVILGNGQGVGMSGVGYGLFGYAWMKGKFDPGAGIEVSSHNVIIMLGWFFVCFIPLIGPIDNTGHAVGLGMGSAWGYLSALKWRR